MLPSAANTVKRISRDRANLDIHWRHASADGAQGETPQTLMREILKDLEEAMREFAAAESEIDQ
jgi:hypothetical protein